MTTDGGSVGGQSARAYGGRDFFFYWLLGQVTLQTPAVNGFAQKAGLRWEATAAKRYTPFDKGSYIEVGGQLVLQNNLLSSVTLSTSGLPAKTCPADSDISISTCFKTAKYPVDASTTVTSTQETLHSGGLYWDIHL